MPEKCGGLLIRDYSMAENKCAATTSAALARMASLCFFQDGRLFIKKA
ncbi:hypothetical protein AB434_1205 [Heyndrickxia coagulans]|uniref:Uncharacterized protein n=1 Tax=Heyndrickxia coagulans TaxID=1398 RepID=A0AAN0TBD2_HEYCO|nr:hypothetical protein SB48_HM08orf06582 [Heyndrickxia coagulans]AKN53610.1 hypothetical protein AB434_1205 [Heyndrickxia coagulans]KYC66258.1 hypothetical protein B4100_1374 [Heyndrickxia coagulans]KYC89316.1 hypothetical protein B4096_1278 [Heyndrickxia coagulans]